MKLSRAFEHRLQSAAQLLQERPSLVETIMDKLRQSPPQAPPKPGTQSSVEQD